LTSPDLWRSKAGESDELRYGGAHVDRLDGEGVLRSEGWSAGMDAGSFCGIVIAGFDGDGAAIDNKDEGTDDCRAMGSRMGPGEELDGLEEAGTFDDEGDPAWVDVRETPSDEPPM